MKWALAKNHENNGRAAIKYGFTKCKRWNVLAAISMTVHVLRYCDSSMTDIGMKRTKYEIPPPLL